MTTQLTTAKNILAGYGSIETAYEVKNYPYGFKLRTSQFYWIESKAGKGDRLGTYTIDPRNGRKNKPKYSTYITFMWMYTDEKGHVQTSGIDSYDREMFAARFEYILKHVGEFYITDVQKQNIRVNHYQHVYGNAPYEIVKYSEQGKELFKAWLRATLTHIKTCPFAELVNYPERPTEDDPTGEVKMIITEYTSKY